LGVPVLVVRGAHSRVLLDEDAARFADLVPNGRWVRIESAGHLVAVDQPGQLATAIEEFLHSVDTFGPQELPLETNPGGS
jgi:pimeloyl-ACP methyl ester carboxylesterase